MHDGSERTAIDIQQVYLDVVRAAIERRGEPDFDTREIITRWQQVLDALRTDPFSATGQVEWLAKYQLLESMRSRGISIPIADLPGIGDKMRTPADATA